MQQTALLQGGPGIKCPLKGSKFPSAFAGKVVELSMAVLGHDRGPGAHHCPVNVNSSSAGPACAGTCLPTLLCYTMAVLPVCQGVQASGTEPEPKLTQFYPQSPRCGVVCSRLSTLTGCCRLCMVGACEMALPGWQQCQAGILLLRAPHASRPYLI